MAEVIVTAAAEAEYIESLLWYADRSVRAAEGFETEFDRAFKRSGPSRIGFRYARKAIVRCSCGDTRFKSFIERNARRLS